MNITVHYKKRNYGLGDTLRCYKIALREVGGLYIEKPVSPSCTHYSTRELEIRFSGDSLTPGRSWDDLSEAEVQGGTLELSHDAALQLANAILTFLDSGKEATKSTNMEIKINEKPLPRRD